VVSKFYGHIKPTVKDPNSCVGCKLNPANVE